MAPVDTPSDKTKILVNSTEDKKDLAQAGPPDHSLPVLFEFPQERKAIISNLTCELHLSLFVKQ